MHGLHSQATAFLMSQVTSWATNKGLRRPLHCDWVRTPATPWHCSASLSGLSSAARGHSPVKFWQSHPMHGALREGLTEDSHTTPRLQAFPPLHRSSFLSHQLLQTLILASWPYGTTVLCLDSSPLSGSQEAMPGRRVLVRRRILGVLLLSGSLSPAARCSHLENSDLPCFSQSDGGFWREGSSASNYSAGAGSCPCGLLLMG